MFKQDISLSSHGKRAKVDNLGTIRVHIHRSPVLFLGMTPDSFDLYLNINAGKKSYNATVESGQFDPKRKNVTIVGVPSSLISELIELVNDKKFMALNNEIIFPDVAMLDGYDVTISVKTETGNVSLDSNMLDNTLWDGIIAIEGGEIQTPFNKLATIAFNLLGIGPEEYGDEEEEDNVKEE